MFNTDFLKEAGRLVIGVLQQKSSKIEIASLVDAAHDDKVKTWLLKHSVEDDGAIKEEPKKILEDCCRKVLTETRFKKETSLLLKKLAEAEKRGDINSFKTLSESYLSKKRA